jgi:hypothetical protein
MSPDLPQMFPERSECSNPWNPLGPSERPSLFTIASRVLKADDNSDEEMAANRLERWKNILKTNFLSVLKRHETPKPRNRLK